jgi:hypothetical protein
MMLPKCTFPLSCVDALKADTTCKTAFDTMNTWYRG